MRAHSTGVFVAVRTIQGGFFITFEGPEGAGKSTQIGLLEEVLRGRGFAVKVTREPGGTLLGERLRELIKHFDGPEGVTPEAELLMFGASRAQHMRLVILPHLAAGGIVLCDRFADSTTVYQGFARRISLEFIDAMHRLTVGDRWPDLTLVLDLDPAAGLARGRLRSPQAAATDRFETESIEFHRRVREGFRRLIAAHPERMVAIDAQPSPESVHLRILEATARVLARVQ